VQLNVCVMGIQHSKLSEMLFGHIEELLAEEVGPVAPFLCEDTIKIWATNLRKENRKPSIKNIPYFAELLSEHIDNQEDRARFIAAVHEIEVLKLYLE
jgi:acyl dehydratase